MAGMTLTVRTPWHLWAVGVLSLLWNALGAWQWVLQMSGDPAYWAAMDPAQAAYLRAAPLWTDMAFGLAVWAGVLGALLLLARRRPAVPVYVVALIAFLADSAYVHLLSDGRAAMGPEGTMFGVVVLVICLIQAGYARWSSRRGVLRWRAWGGARSC